MTLPEPIVDNGKADRNFQELEQRTAVLEALSGRGSVFYASTYGVVADAVQDATTGTWTGTDNTDSWSAVFAAADAVGGGLIIGPNGPVLGNMPQDVSTNILLDGAGLNSRYICTTDLSGPMLAFTGPTGSGAEDTVYQDHLYGVGITDRVWLDGHGRQAADAIGLKFFRCDRIYLGGNIRHFANQGVQITSSVRESAVNGCYISNCGTFDANDDDDAPAFDLYDVEDYDGSNNISFIGMKIVYSGGNAMRIERNHTNAGNRTVRNLYFYGSMLHNLEGTNLGASDYYDGYPYTFGAEYAAGHCLVLRNARQVFFQGRMQASGRGMSHVWIGEEGSGGANGGATTNDLHLIGTSIGASTDSGGYTETVTSDSTADTLSATDLLLSTGAVFRADGTVGGLAADTDYWAIYVDDDTIQVAASYADALAGTEIALNNTGGDITARDIKIEIDPDSGTLPNVELTNCQIDATDDDLAQLVSRHSAFNLAPFSNHKGEFTTQSVTADFDVVRRATAAALVLKGNVPVYKISGTDDITSINAADCRPGRVVTLIFLGTAATTGVTDGTALRLNGNFAYTPNDTLTLACDGTDWYEIARSTN